ncbi:MAG: glycosyltransferase [Sphingomonadales bacterium]|nr:MAG: glycosyltransferase [Sphingomonadales bacterium]
MQLTIGIKCLNEEAKIAACLESAVRAAANYDSEIILADSGSTDRTIDIAQGFPIRIVQLANVADRSCGAGAQLAFQYARGSYFYLLDGDMILNPEFIAVGIEFLENNPEFAAVGGHSVERNTDTAEFAIRAGELGKLLSHTGIVDRLDGGGLYRAEAIRAAGFFADRNLHSFEELELAARLQTDGWKLARINLRAYEHYGHSGGSYRLLWRRFRSGYAGSPGELIRSAMGKRHLGFIVQRLRHTWYMPAIFLWWLLLPASAFVSIWATLLLLCLPIVLLSLRRGSLSLGIYSFASWNIIALGTLMALVRPRTSPLEPLEAIDLSPDRIAPETR